MLPQVVCPRTTGMICSGITLGVQTHSPTSARQMMVCACLRDSWRVREALYYMQITASSLVVAGAGVPIKPSVLHTLPKDALPIGVHELLTRFKKEKPKPTH